MDLNKVGNMFLNKVEIPGFVQLNMFLNKVNLVFKQG